MNRAATIALSPLSMLYGAAVKARSAGYRNGFLKTQRVSAPVVSVGNLTLGGTGKTPLVQWIARQIAGSGHRVCVVTRGYGRDNPKERVLVSDGKQILSDINRSGDEAFMLAERLRDKASVVCDVDRVAGAKFAIENLNADVLVLDDGFQHRRLARDLNIVTIDATNPFGNGRLLPSGTLREPINSLGRADCVVLTRVSERMPELIERIRKRTNAPILESRMVIQQIHNIDSAEGASAPALLDDQPLFAFCGIGNPQAFSSLLRSAVSHINDVATFRDHHVYSQSDIDRLTQQARTSGAKALITTAKDAVKLQSMRFDLPCYVAEIEMEIPQSAQLLALIEQAINLRSRT